MTTTFRPSTGNFAPGHGTVTNLLQALNRAGKRVETIVASLYEVMDLVAVPFPVDGVIQLMPHPRFMDVEVLIIEEFDRADADTAAWIQTIADNIAEARVHFPKLETVLFI